MRDTIAEDTTGIAGGPDAPAADPVVDPGAATPPADAPVSEVEPDGSDPSALPPWTVEEVSWALDGRPPVPPTARELRAARHDGFDRWVLDFGEALPGYRVRYVDRPLHECGSGEQIHPVGEGFLELRMEPAQGHTDAGRPTLPRGRETPSLARGLRFYRTCDFEGVVTLVMALDSPEPFRAFHLRGPARVVVDVRH